MIATKIKLDASPGETVWGFAQRLLDHAIETGEDQDAEFNGTPMKAYPDDCRRAVVLDWELRRLHIQHKGSRCDHCGLYLAAYGGGQ